MENQTQFHKNGAGKWVATCYPGGSYEQTFEKDTFEEAWDAANDYVGSFNIFGQTYRLTVDHSPI